MKQLFDEMVHSGPPSTVDVAAIVRREKRRRVIRHGGVTFAVAVLTAGVLGVALTTTPPGRDGPAPNAVQPPAPADSGFRLLANDREAAEATAARLRQELDRALTAAAPGATWLARDFYGRPAPDGQPPILIAPDADADATQMFYGGTGVGLAGRRGGFTLEVYSLRPCTADNPKCTAERSHPQFEKRARERLLTCRTQEGCEVRTGPGGVPVLVTTTATSPPAANLRWPFRRYEARVGLVDGRVLALAVDNEDHTGSGKGAPAQDLPALTTDQLVAMVVSVAGQIRA